MTCRSLLRNAVVDYADLGCKTNTRRAMIKQIISMNLTDRRVFENMARLRLQPNPLFFDRASPLVATNGCTFPLSMPFSLRLRPAVEID